MLTASILASICEASLMNGSTLCWTPVIYVTKLSHKRRGMAILEHHSVDLGTVADCCCSRFVIAIRSKLKFSSRWFCLAQISVRVNLFFQSTFDPSCCDLLEMINHLTLELVKLNYFCQHWISVDKDVVSKTSLDCLEYKVATSTQEILGCCP